MRETRPSGSVEGVVGNHNPYSDPRLVWLPWVRVNRRAGSAGLYAEEVRTGVWENPRTGLYGNCNRLHGMAAEVEDAGGVERV
jgi:hypothetical protein